MGDKILVVGGGSGAARDTSETLSLPAATWTQGTLVPIPNGDNQRQAALQMADRFFLLGGFASGGSVYELAPDLSGWTERAERIGAETHTHAVVPVQEGLWT